MLARTLWWDDQLLLPLMGHDALRVGATTANWMAAGNLLQLFVAVCTYFVFDIGNSHLFVSTSR